MCTGIKIDYKNGCLIGRTMDYEVPLDYNASYLPRNFKYANDLMGNPLYTKYKILGMCFMNRIPLKDGVNEHGLAGITNDFNSFNLYSNKVDEEKKNISSLDYFTYALANYKTVDELVEDLPNIHISEKDHKGEKVLSPDFHFMFSDSSKKCVIVEPKKKELLFYDNPYNVMTNSPGLSSHVRRLNKVIGEEDLREFNSAKKLPGGYDPLSRFVKAFYLTRMNIDSETFNQALSNFYNIMNAMTMPEGFVRRKEDNNAIYTRYICGYDTREKLLTVKTHTNPTVYNLGFGDIEDENEKQSFFLENQFTSEKLI